MLHRSLLVLLIALLPLLSIGTADAAFPNEIATCNNDADCANQVRALPEGVYLRLGPVENWRCDAGSCVTNDSARWEFQDCLGDNAHYAAYTSGCARTEQRTVKEGYPPETVCVEQTLTRSPSGDTYTSQGPDARCFKCDNAAMCQKTFGGAQDQWMCTDGKCEALGRLTGSQIPEATPYLILIIILVIAVAGVFAIRRR